MRGLDVCLVDADAQRSSARWYATREAAELKPTITLVEKRENLSQTLKSLDQRFDHVIVDVAGRNSRELITGCTVAHQIIAPHQCSQLDLDTLLELEEQLVAIRDLNPDLKAYCYQSMATTNPVIRGTERSEFLGFVQEIEGIIPLESTGCYRKVYRDVIPEGKSVLETENENARKEIMGLIEELFDVK